MSRFTSISLLLCLLSLPACWSGRVRTITETKVVKVIPPANFLTPCRLPEFDPPLTNADLVYGFLDWKEAALNCSAQMDALRVWALDTLPD